MCTYKHVIGQLELIYTLNKLCYLVLVIPGTPESVIHDVYIR